MGVELNVTVTSNNSECSSETIVVPVIAIECKTYIERNMYDSCSGTARRLKSASPYCMYVVAAEYMKLKDASPELSDIDELYIFCRATNSERADRKKRNEPPHEIAADLMYDLFCMVKKHLHQIWWSPEDALERGKVINRP